MVIQSALVHFHHGECGQKPKADRMQTFCRGCQSLVLADNQSREIARNVPRVQIATRPRGLRRCSVLLPVHQRDGRLTLVLRSEKALSIQDEMVKLEDIFAAPEEAANLAAPVHFQEQDRVQSEEQIVPFKTVTGLKNIAG